MQIRRILKSVVPSPVRRLGWRGYYYARNNWLKSVVGCRTTQRIVALTFDDGPNPDCTPLILEILAHYHVKATFFSLGENVVSYPELARKVHKAGHAVGNHTFTHRRLVGCSPATVVRELSQCQRALREVTGAVPRIMRPPSGAQDLTSYLTARIMGYRVVTWSVSGKDCLGDPAPVVTERILAEIQPGGIITLHDGWEPPHNQVEGQPEHNLFQDRSPTIEALPTIIEHLQTEGYEFVTLPEMIRMGPLRGEAWFDYL